MTFADTLLSGSMTFALVVLAAALLITVVRVIRGPSLPDRVMALDMLVAIAIGFLAVSALKSGHAVYVDIAIAIALAGFLATVAFARFILRNAARNRRTEGDKR